jgi:hypothetical protein
MRTFILQLTRINFFVAMGAGVLALGWCSFLGLDDALIFSGLITFSVCSVYTAHRIYKCERKLSQAEMNDWYAKNKALVKTTFFISFMMMCVCLRMLNLSFSQYLLLGIGALFSTWYVVPIFSFRLREISLIKAPLVALVWMGILVVFPQLESVPFTLDFMAFALAFFCYFLALTIPFDVRDLSQDATTHDTIPMVLGVGKSRCLAVILLVASALIIAKINQNSWLMFLLIPSYVITAVFVLATNEYRKEAFYAGLDATMVLVGIAFYLVS